MREPMRRRVRVMSVASIIEITPCRKGRDYEDSDSESEIDYDYLETLFHASCHDDEESDDTDEEEEANNGNVDELAEQSDGQLERKTSKKDNESSDGNSSHRLMSFSNAPLILCNVVIAISLVLLVVKSVHFATFLSDAGLLPPAIGLGAATVNFASHHRMILNAKPLRQTSKFLASGPSCIKTI